MDDLPPESSIVNDADEDVRPSRLNATDELPMEIDTVLENAGCARSVVPPAFSVTVQPPDHVPDFEIVTDAFRLTASLRANVRSAINS